MFAKTQQFLTTYYLCNKLVNELSAQGAHNSNFFRQIFLQDERITFAFTIKRYYFQVVFINFNLILVLCWHPNPVMMHQYVFQTISNFVCVLSVHVYPNKSVLHWQVKNQLNCKSVSNNDNPAAVKSFKQNHKKAIFWTQHPKCRKWFCMFVRLTLCLVVKCSLSKNKS